MTEEKISPSQLGDLLILVAARIEREEGRLNALDSAVGDGDHGITMRSGFDAVAEKLRGLDDHASIGMVLTESGKSFMGATGGAIGVLMGKMLLSAGTALRGCSSLGATEFKTLLSTMEASLAKTAKAQPGDKTILDAVHGACQAISGTDAPLRDLALNAASGAEAGAQATAQMLCRLGRGSKLGDRVLGCPDPGAVSFAIMLRAISDGLECAPSSVASTGRLAIPEEES